MADFDWRAYLDHAFLVVQLPPHDPKEPQDEARRHSAVSRGYYALHNIAREYATLFMSFKQDDQDKAHWQLIKLMREGSLEEKGVSRLLDDLRRLRNKADYDSEPLGKTDAEVMLALAQIKKSITSLDASRKRRETLRH